MRRTALVQFASVPAVIVLLALGCGGDTASGAGESCQQASDCADGLSCIGGICQNPVTTQDTGNPPVKDGGHPDAGKDAGHDAGHDGGVDAGADAGGDAATDAGSDGATDAGTDAGEDVGIDAGEDVGTDAGADAGGDAEVDAGADAGGDAEVDAGADTGADAEVDVGVDAGGDTGSDAGSDGGTAPTTTLAGCPAAYNNSPAEVFQFSAGYPGANFDCSVDGAVWAACSSPATVAALADGPHTFAVRAVVGGLADPNPPQCAWTTDTTPPVSHVDSGPGAPCNSTGATFGFSCNEIGCTFECEIDGGAWAACTSPKAYSGLADGAHVFSVRATDRAGNTDATAAQAAWSIDTAAPHTTINNGPSNPSGFDTADFTFSAGEPNVTFECKLDGGAWTVCTSPQHYAGLAETSHTFSVRATDACGNVDPAPASQTWIVDLSAVSTRIDSGPPALTNQTGASFTFSCNKTGCTFECQIDGGAWSSCAAPKAYSGLADGAHTFSVRATDGTGNRDLNPPKETWVVDTAAPVTTMTGHPADPTNQTTAIFSFSCSEPGTVSCRLDGAAPAACTSPATYTGLADGSHTFTAVCTDAAGNTDPSGAQFTWAVDTAVPTTQITSAPPAYTNQTSVSVGFTSSAPGATFECQFNGASWVACTSPAAYTGLADGTYTFAVRSVDQAGNVDPNPPSTTWTVDTLSPTTQITSGPGVPCNTNTATFTFGCSEPACTFECSLDAGAWAACTSPAAYSGLADGAHIFGVRATDRAGNVDTSNEQAAWSIDTVAPDTNITGGPTDPSGFDTADFTFSANESGVTFECKLDGGSWTACASPQHYAGLAETSHTFSVRATDACGNTDATPATQTWTVNLGPVSTRIDSGPAALTNQTAATFTFSCNKASCTYECNLDNAGWASCAPPKTYNGLADGTHTFSVRATDGVGNVDQNPPVATWVIDTAPPVTTITSHPGNPTNLPTAIFSFTCSEPGSAACALDGTGPAACTSPVTYTGLTDGPHTFSVACTDAAGNADPVGASYAWTIDTAAPLTQITAAPPAFTSQTDASISFTSSEPGATFECSLNGSAWAACTSPKAYTGLTDGAYTFEVRSIDQAGNVDPNPATTSWTVDTVAPDTTITGKPPDPSNTTSPVFTFTSNEAGATFQCRLDGGAWGACSSPDTLSGLASASHTFDVRAVDRAGNIDQTPASYTWTIDTTPPVTTITSKPNDPSPFSSASFTFTCNEPGGTECNLDGAGWSSCTSPASYTGLADGTHNFTVRCVDTAGNRDPAPPSYAWTVDTTPPDSTIISGPPSPTNVTDATFTFTCSEPGQAECRLDAGAWGVCTSPVSYTGLGDATHLFSVQCTDLAGNTDPSPATYPWTVDTTPPNTNITAGPPALTNNTAASFSFTATETGSTFQCQLDGGAFLACASPQGYGPLADGTHQFCVKATDPAGNTDPTPACATWKIDTTPPDTLLLTYPPNPTAGTTATFTFDATESGCSFQCQLDGGAWAACASPAVYTGLSGTSHTFAVRATDQAGNTDQTPASYAWTIDTTAPHSTILTKPANPTNSQTAVFTFTSDDPSATYECDLDGGGWTSCVSGVTYNGLGAGGHTFSVRGTDPLGNVEATPPSYSWTIDLTPPDTTITVMPNNPSNVASPSFTFTATEPGSTFECQIDAGGWGGCTSPKTVGPLTEASHTFAVRATDPAGNTDPTPASYTWTVDLTAPDTSLVSTPNTYTNSTTATFSFSSTENPSTFECQIDGGAWAACATPKTYNGLADGAHTFAVRATDQAGNTDQSPVTFAWTIDTVAPDTSIDSKPPAYSNQTSATFAFSCSGETQPCTFECSLDAGGYALCTTPQQYSGLSNASHTFRVRAKDAAGNTDATPATYTWTVDTVAPNAFIDSMPGNPSLVTDATFTFHCSESGTTECELDAAGWASCTSPKTYNGLSETTHTFQVRCTDLAGNVSSPASYTWDISIWTSETVDSGRFFTNFYHRSIATDQNNYAHIVYGGANLYHMWFNGSTWSVETLDTSHGVGQYANLVYDSSWNMHIAYWDEPNGDLLYLTNTGGSWTKSTIDAAINSGQYASLAVDSAGKAHISYYDASNLDLKYATNASGSWVTRTVDGAGFTAGQYSSIAVDASGYVHISYYDGTNADLKYATNAPAGVWSTATVDGAGGINVGQFSSIALDAAGNSHIAYYDGTNADLKYVNNVGGAWNAPVSVDTVNTVGQYTSILVDPSNNVHISYYDGTNADLKYANYNGAVWTRTTIDSTGTVGLYTSIARDATGKLHVSYYDGSNFKLKYAVKSGASWVAFALDTAVHVGQWTSLAIDNANKLHTCYYDVLNADLKYATNSSGAWVPTAVDTFGAIGQYCHIGVDSNRKPRISYYDASGGDLKYADNVFGSWAPITLDNPNNVGQYTGLSVDKNDKVHISYYDVTNGDLRYASDESGSWAIAIPDSANNVGQYSAIATDAAGWSHVSYYDATNGDLRYANNVGGSWNAPVPIDTVNNMGQWTAIAVDGGNHVHVSYYNATNGDLKYAYFDGASWTVNTIESNNVVGQYTSIAVDTNAKAHISYYDATNLDLKYATNKYGAWQTFVVDSVAWVGQYTGIALDAVQKPHITYYDQSMRSLKHATNSH